jgi:hypothetical protein
MTHKQDPQSEISGSQGVDYYPLKRNIFKGTAYIFHV